MSANKGFAVAYVRISTEEQLKRSATNIATQTKKCAEACERAGLELVKVFTDEGESAYKQAASERPQLQAMVNYLKLNKKRITHVVTADLSRLARRIEDQASLLAAFRKGGITYVSVDEPHASDNSAAGQLATGMLGLVNQFHSASLSERVTYRMRSGAQSGRHLHLAPLGYLNGTHNGVKNLVPDPERAELVRKAFALVADGHNMIEVLRIVTAMGLVSSRTGRKLTKGTFCQMLRNRAYAGWVKQKDIVARASFEPLVSEELFERAQEALKSRGKRQKHVKHHEDWPLRRFVLCAHCGKPLTAGWVKNGAGKPYGFYFCGQKGCRAVSVRKEYLEHGWLTLLLMTQPREDYLQRLPELVEAAWQQRKAQAEEEQRQLTSRLSEQVKMNKRAIESRIKGQINDQDFATMKKAIADEIEQIEHAIKRLDDERAGVRELAKIKEYQLKNLCETWQKSDLNQRVELQFALFPNGLHWEKNNGFLNKANPQLFQAYSELLGDLVGDGGRQRT
ncbi:MAG: recombinase family protein [Acidobacteria bacterium]|nr:recombinase family protein [Acidobacteriota bacterium]